MNKTEMTKKLQESANNNKSFKEIYKMLTFRERSLNILTVSGLYQRLLREGYKVPRTDLPMFIKHLGELGLGKVTYNASGKVMSLKDIKLTLKSIGEVALGVSDAELESYQMRNRYSDLYVNISEDDKSVPSPFTTTSQPVKTEDKSTAISIIVKGKQWSLTVPDEVTSSDIAQVIEQLHKLSTSNKK